MDRNSELSNNELDLCAEVYVTEQISVPEKTHQCVWSDYTLRRLSAFTRLKQQESAMAWPSTASLFII